MSAPSTPGSEIHAGTVVAERFVIERLAGAGGMGSVYAAQDRFDGARVALKVLRALGPDDEVRFTREAEVLRALSHPGIVRYVAHGTARGMPFLAMEWIEGEDLGERIARGPLPATEVMALGRSIADALAVVHERGVVHRDLKASNVRIAARGPVLVDFGVARARDLGPVSVTRTGAIVGTPLTMAPEQARGVPDVDARADVFALGTLIHECLTGVPPFIASSLIAVLARILLDSVPPPSERVSGVPPALDALVLRMLEKDPDSRPANGAAVRALLDGIATGAGITPPVPSRRGLSLEETRYATCVVIRGTVPLDRTVSADKTQADDRALRAIAASHGALLERLLDGSLVALVLGGVREEQAVRGARCALALRDATGLPAALAAGKATTGARVPVGDAIERALEVLDDAGPGEVATNTTTSDLLSARFLTERRGDHALVLSPVGAAPRTVRGRSTPFVGRRRELASLASLVTEALEDHASRAALVTAAPGLGKSRLAAELRARIGSEHADAECLLILADDALASSPNTFARSLARALLDRARGPLEHAPFARDLAGLAPLDDASEQLVALVQRDGTARRARHVRALVELITVASSRGLALLLDDAQWIDDASASMIDEAIGELDGLPVAAIALARPEGTSLFSGRSVEALRLSPLAARAADELARHVLGDAADLALVARAVDAASGHPLLLEEILRAGPDAVGDDVIALVQGRIGQLAPDARVVLRAASVMGPHAAEGAIAELVDRDRPSVRSAIEACVRAELLERTETRRFEGEPELRFRHALMRDAAYGMLTESDRALGHKLALGWLERKGESDRLLLAEHAVRAARSSGDHASAGLRFVEAARLAPRAVDGFAALLRAKEMVALAGESGVRAAGEVARAHAYWLGRAGKREVARARLDAAMVAARAANDRTLLVALLPSRGWTLAAIGEHERGVADLEEADSLANDPDERFAIAKARATVSFFANDLDRTIVLTDEVVSQAEALGLDREVATHLHNAGEWRLRAGRLGEAEATLERSNTLAESVGEVAIMALNRTLITYIRSVRLRSALPETELEEITRCASRFASVELTWEEMTVRTFHAHALCHARGLPPARTAFMGLEARATELGMPSYAVAARAALSELDEGRLPPLR